MKHFAIIDLDLLFDPKGFNWSSYHALVTTIPSTVKILYVGTLREYNTMRVALDLMEQSQEKSAGKNAACRQSMDFFKKAYFLEKLTNYIEMNFRIAEWYVTHARHRPTLDSFRRDVVLFSDCARWKVNADLQVTDYSSFYNRQAMPSIERFTSLLNELFRANTSNHAQSLFSENGMQVSENTVKDKRMQPDSSPPMKWHYTRGPLAIDSLKVFLKVAHKNTKPGIFSIFANGTREMRRHLREHCACFLKNVEVQSKQLGYSVDSAQLRVISYLKSCIAHSRLVDKELMRYLNTVDACSVLDVAYELSVRPRGYSSNDEDTWLEDGDPVERACLQTAVEAYARKGGYRLG